MLDEIEALRQLTLRAGALAERVAEEQKLMQAMGIDTCDGQRLSPETLAEVRELQAELGVIERMVDHGDVADVMTWYRKEMEASDG